MTSRERTRSIIARTHTADERPSFWMGNPHHDSWPALIEAFAGGNDSGAAIATESELRLAVQRELGDDYAWVRPEPECYHHPEGHPIWALDRDGLDLAAGGPLADAESVAEVDDLEWPNPDYLDFTEYRARLESMPEVYRAGGFWTHFYHLVADFFGMENYFVKTFTHPDVVHAATRHIVDFFLEANRRCFDAVGDLVDGFFFGNDFGTQLDLLMSPESLQEFVFPYFKELTEMGHACGKQVILHSCGSIYRVIPNLIELGVDALHPLQANAANMEAERLGAEFRGSIAFIGGIDTQELLVNGSPDDVQRDVTRVAAALGPNLVVSPSHEALLPDVPVQNVRAISQAVRSLP